MSVRQQKISAQIRRLVAEFIQRELADPRADGLISVTKVDITSDLSLARVYLSIFGNKTPTPTVFAFRHRIRRSGPSNPVPERRGP